MADKDSTTIDFDKVEAILQEWNTAIGSFDPQKASQDGTLLALQNAGLESGFISSYDQNYETAKTQITNVAADIRAAYQAFLDAEDDADKKKPKGPGNKKPKGPGGDDNTHTDEELEALQLKEYEKISLENLDGITDELISLAKQENITIDELLSNDKYKEKVLTLLSSSKNVPDDLKELMKESSSVTQKVLEDISNGKYPKIIGFDDNVEVIYYKYLTNVANNNNITLNDLMNKDDYKDLLKQSFKKFGSVTDQLKGLDDSAIVEKLQKVKNGELKDVDNDTLSILKEYADLDSKDQVTSAKNGAKFGVFTKLSDDDKNDVKSLMDKVIEQNDKARGYSVRPTETSQDETQSTTPTESQEQGPTTTTEPTETTQTTTSEEPVAATPQDTTPTATEEEEYKVNPDGSIDVPIYYVPTEEVAPVVAASYTPAEPEMQTIVYESPSVDVSYSEPVVSAPTQPEVTVQPVVETPVVETQTASETSNEPIWSQSSDEGAIEVPIDYVTTGSSQDSTDDMVEIVY